MEHYGKQLERARRDTGLTKDELYVLYVVEARADGIRPATVDHFRYKWLTGRVKIPTEHFVPAVRAIEKERAVLGLPPAFGDLFALRGRDSNPQPSDYKPSPIRDGNFTRLREGSASPAVKVA